MHVLLDTFANPNLWSIEINLAMFEIKTSALFEILDVKVMDDVNRFLT
jgi:hypothetical protein